MLSRGRLSAHELRVERRVVPRGRELERLEDEGHEHAAGLGVRSMLELVKSADEYSDISIHFKT